MTKAKKRPKAQAPKAAQAVATPKTRAPKLSDKDAVVKIIGHLQVFDDDYPQSAEHVYQATRIDWYTVRRLFQENPRIFQATSETRRARYSLTPAGRKVEAS